MKSYDYDAVVYDGDIYCTNCLPAMILDDENTMPIFADSEWGYIPVCCRCGCSHDYVTVLQ
jgi:hypothetical protein